MADQLTIRVSPTFHGIMVAVDGGPTKGDPLGQRTVFETFATLEEAIDALPRLTKLELVRREAAFGAKPEGQA